LIYGVYDTIVGSVGGFGCKYDSYISERFVAWPTLWAGSVAYNLLSNLSSLLLFWFKDDKVLGEHPIVEVAFIIDVLMFECVSFTVLPT